jgi:hypothetical protein
LLLKPELHHWFCDVLVTIGYLVSKFVACQNNWSGGWNVCCTRKLSTSY